jgi:putative copper export protein
MAKGESSWLRWLRIACRTIHIATLAVVVGGVMFGASPDQLGVWVGGVVLTGMALMTTDLLGTDPYLRLVHGMAMLVKLALLALAVWFDGARLVLLFVVVAISSVVSHMSGRYRHHPVWGEPMDGH